MSKATKYAATLSALLALSVAAPAQAQTASWSFEPSSYDYGVRLPGSEPVSKAFELVNTGEVELQVGFIVLGGRGEGGGSNPFSLGSNNCGSLAPGVSCAIEVSFHPDSAGVKHGELSVSDPDTGTSATALLRGTGAGPIATLTPASLSFESREVGAAASPAQTVTLSNEGQLDLTISSVSLYTGFVLTDTGERPPQFEVVGGTCTTGLVLPPAGSCAAEVAFVPTVAGVGDSQLRIADNAPGSPHVVALEGMGIEPPVHRPPPPPPSSARAFIIHRPHKVTSRRNASFRFRGSAGAVSFECKLDSRRLTPCTSPARYRHLKPGHHSFAVRAVDAAGHLTRDATRFRWRIKARR